MGHISLRIPDGDERRLRNSARLQQVHFTAYLRQLLELGEQTGNTLSKQQAQLPSNKSTSVIPPVHSVIMQAVHENRYLLRYLIGKLFSEEGQKAKNIAQTQAEQDTYNYVDE